MPTKLKAPTDPVVAARALLARAYRHYNRDDTEGLADARRNYTAAKLEAHIREALAEATPLTQGQRSELALLILSGETR